MIANPGLFQFVRVHYRKGVRPAAPYHGATGWVVLVGRGKPRNHAVRIGPDVVVIPCGNLVPESERP